MTLIVTAYDPDCPGTCTTGCGQYIRADLTNWQANGGSLISENNGASSSPYSASAEWQAPTAEGMYSVTVNLADSGTFLCGGRQTTADTVDIIVTSNTNQPPVIEDVGAQPGQLVPGQASLLTCVASDPEGDPINYGWSANPGTVTPGPPGTATYYPPPTGIGIATVTCTASDGTTQVSDTVQISIVGAQGEKALTRELVAPQRVAADPQGNLFVVDSRAGGLAVINLFSEELIYRLDLSGLTSVAVDWNGDLLLGGPLGADVRDLAGQQRFPLNPGASVGDVSDVAADLVNRRYGVLYRSAGRVVVFDESGAQVVAFGSTGSAPDQLRSPQGLAATPQGNWVVADSGNGQIKTFDAAGNLLDAFGEFGGAAGEWVQLDDVEVDGSGVIWASDAYQSWVQSFDPNGSLRETIGTYGTDLGQFKTPRGLTWVQGIIGLDGISRMVVASANSSALQVFRPNNNQLPGPPPAPTAELTPDSFTFPETAVGQSSPPQIATLSNVGNALLGVTRINTEGPYRHSKDCGSFLEAGSFCTISVTFHPTSAGTSEGRLVVETTTETFTVQLSGQGFVPAGVELVPQSLGFNDQEIGTISEPQFVTLTNTGSLPLEILSIHASTEYLVTHSCTSPLAAAGSCTLEVRFAPVTVADHIYGAVTLASSAAGSPHTVALDGSGIPTIPRFSVIALEPEGVEEGDEGDEFLMEFEVTLSPPSTRISSVHYETVDGTAVAGEDYLSAAATLEFQPGKTRQTVSVRLFGDGILEPDEETFTVDLWGPLAALIEDGSATGRIADDEVCLGSVLVKNAGAEVLSGNSRIPSWVESPDQAWEIRSLSPDPYEGIAYFAAAPEPYAELVQEIDVGSFTDAIDAGAQLFDFSAWVQTADEDWARVVIEYRNWDKTVVLDRFDSGDIVSPEQWHEITDFRAAVPGTRWVRVKLSGQRRSGVENNAFFDSVSLRPVRAATVIVENFSAYEGDAGVTGAVFAVSLPCPYYQEVFVEFSTNDDTAAADEDYYAATGTVVLPVGQIEEQVTIELLGDEWDEGHETFFVDIESVEPVNAVHLTERSVGTILDDDFCPLPSAWWSGNADLLPEWLALGGVVYDWVQVAGFLGYQGGDVTMEVARTLSATKLNLDVGSSPSIVSTIEAADGYLAVYPPGSDPDGSARRQGKDLRDTLKRYNKGGCRMDSPSSIPPSGSADGG